ncbi:MAG: calcium/sodium antiporter [Bacteroidales bacterium]|nr:calcium/sodium antiporter [Bacteroidales bacterium]
MALSILILLAGLALVIIGADLLVDGASAIARKAGLSEFLIGMTIVGIGTSMPELVVSFTGALKGSADIAIGNVVGSNIFNVFLILGLTALVSPVAISPDNKRRDIPVNIIVTVLLIIFGMSHTLLGLGKSDTISAWKGIVFLVLFMLYMLMSFKTGKIDSAEDSAVGEPVAGKKIWLAILMVLGGLAGLVFGGDVFVDSACEIARSAGLSEKFVAITILACGTSLPELVTCVVAAAKKKGALALGNIIGSNVSNILLILGSSALVCPLSFANIKAVDLGAVALGSIALLTSAWTGRNNRIGRGDGVAFLLMFTAYMAYLFMTV